jgi:hypothetical protein
MHISLILNLIRAEVAENGEITPTAMRAYCENKISYKVFMAFVGQGMKVYKRKHK